MGIQIKMNVKSLHTRWKADCHRAGLKDPNGIIFQWIVASYGEAHRCYHTLEHLDHGFAAMDDLEAALYKRQLELGIKTLSLDEARFAMWFHDCVYRTSGPGSEEDSGIYAMAQLERMGASAEFCDEVYRLIELTSDHAYAEDDLRAAWLCEADLQILASQTWKEYCNYVEKVRREFSQYSDEDWTRGRLAVMQGLQKQEPLFSLVKPGTYSFSPSVDGRNFRASQNIRREIEELEKQVAWYDANK